MIEVDSAAIAVDERLDGGNDGLATVGVDEMLEDGNDGLAAAEVDERWERGNDGLGASSWETSDTGGSLRGWNQISGTVSLGPARGQSLSLDDHRGGGQGTWRRKGDWQGDYTRWR